MNKTFSSLLHQGRELLKNRGASVQPQSAYWLLLKAAKIHHSDWFRILMSEVSEKIEQVYMMDLERLVQGYPLQLILGEVEFFNCLIKVKEGDALIPRSETEAMIAKVVDDYHEEESPINILDLGTGTGCLAISSAKAFPESRVLAIDISSQALDLGKENASLNGLSDQITWRKESMEQFFQSNDMSFDLVLSNPPYISMEGYNTLDDSVRSFEPRIALTDEGDGLKYLDLIFSQIEKTLQPEGKAYVEFGFNQGPFVEKTLKQKTSLTFQIYQDLQKHPRFVKVERIKNLH